MNKNLVAAIVMVGNSGYLIFTEGELADKISDARAESYSEGYSHGLMDGRSDS